MSCQTSKETITTDLTIFFQLHRRQRRKRSPPPTLIFILNHSGIYCCFSCLFRQLLRYLITELLSNYHPLLELERHHHILARHTAVDGFSCFICAYIGFQNRHQLEHLLALERNDDFNDRVQVLLFFFSYQVKNMYDTIVWEDSVVFILHHILAGATAWFGMCPGLCSLYVIFFMGISEISTSILCLLANFDPDLGIIGLDEAFPMTRIILATCFIVTFIICRIILWPLFAYHIAGDIPKALKQEGEKGRPSVKFALKLILGSLCGLSILQVICLGAIIVTAKKEIDQFF